MSIYSYLYFISFILLSSWAQAQHSIDYTISSNYRTPEEMHILHFLEDEMPRFVSSTHDFFQFLPQKNDDLKVVITRSAGKSDTHFDPEENTIYLEVLKHSFDPQELKGVFVHEYTHYFFDYYIQRQNLALLQSFADIKNKVQEGEVTYHDQKSIFLFFQSFVFQELNKAHHEFFADLVCNYYPATDYKCARGKKDFQQASSFYTRKLRYYNKDLPFLPHYFLHSVIAELFQEQKMNQSLQEVITKIMPILLDNTLYFFNLYGKNWAKDLVLEQADAKLLKKKKKKFYKSLNAHKDEISQRLIQKIKQAL